jgi:hypothetical protein
MKEVPRDCYQPKLPRELVHEIWVIGQELNLPMTVVIRCAVEEYIEKLSVLKDESKPTGKLT